MGSFAPYLITLGRLLLAPVFIQSGLSKIFDYAGTQSLMEAHGLPGLLLVPTIAVEVLGGLGVLLGSARAGRRWRSVAFASWPLSSSIWIPAIRRKWCSSWRISAWPAVSSCWQAPAPARLLSTIGGARGETLALIAAQLYNGVLRRRIDADLPLNSMGRVIAAELDERPDSSEKRQKIATDNGMPAAASSAAIKQPAAPPASQPPSVATWNRNAQAERLAWV